MSLFTKQHLGELVDILSGFAFDSKKFGDSGELPIVRIRDVIPGSSSTFYSGEYDPKFVIRDGDLLIGMDGEFNRARWQGGNALLNQRVCRIAASSRDLDDAYLFHFLPLVLKAIEDVTPYVTVKHLSVKTIRNIEIFLPPLEEQRRIAEILDRAEEIRSKRREAIAQLNALTQAIFIEMFGDPVFNPQRWQRVELVNMCSSANDIKCGPFGTQLSKDEYITEGIPLWGIKNVNALFKIPTHEFLEAQTAKKLIQYSIEPGDIVMTRKGTVGNCAVYPDSYPLGIMHSDLLRLRVNRKKCDPMFLSHQLHYSRDVGRQLTLISGGAIMPGINVTKLKTLEVLVPPLVLQQEFAHRIEAVEKLKASHRASLSELDALFASLQHRAFRGEL